jgi:hypothetical protein
MEISSKVEYIIGKNLIPKIKSIVSNVEIKIENSELEDKQFKDFLKSYYNFYDSSKIDTIFIIEVNLNDETYRGLGIGSYDTKTNISSLYFEWESLPKYEVQDPSGGSIICWDYSTYSKAYQGAVNISSVAGTLEGFPLEANVTYLTLNDEGEIVFQGYQKGIVKTINGVRVGKVKLVGFIDEKFRLNTSPGYAVYLTQKNDNIISGVYNQIQVDSMGRMYYEAAIREYKIYSGRKLPFDEVMIFKYKKDANFNQIKNNKRIDSMSHIAYYMPAKDPYGR